MVSPSIRKSAAFCVLPTTPTIPQQSAELLSWKSDAPATPSAPAATASSHELPGWSLLVVELLLPLL